MQNSNSRRELWGVDLLKFEYAPVAARANVCRNAIANYKLETSNLGSLKLEGSISKDCEKKGEGSRNALEQRIGNHVALQHHPATLPNCSTHRYPLPGVWDRTPVPAGVATTSDLVGPKVVHVRDVRPIQLHSLRQHLFWTPLAQLRTW